MCSTRAHWIADKAGPAIAAEMMVVFICQGRVLAVAG